MVIKHYQKLRKSFKKKHAKGTNRKKKKQTNILKRDIKMLLKKKEKKRISIIINVSKSYLRIEEIIIYHIRNNF